MGKFEIVSSDTIKLPSKNSAYSDLIQDIIYQVVFIDNNGLVRVFDFINEKEANAFLAKLNGGKHERLQVKRN